MDNSSAKELQKYISENVKKLREWLKPDPKDSLGLKIIKGIYKSLAVLLLLIFSPVICLVLTVAFFAAF